MRNAKILFRCVQSGGGRMHDDDDDGNDDDVQDVQK